MSSANSELVLAYTVAFERKDRAAVRRMLADKGTFKGPLQTFHDADTFLDEAELFMRLAKKFEIKKVVADGDDVAVFLDYVTIVPSLPPTEIAEWFKVGGGKIQSIHLHFDPRALIAAKERGDFARALQSA